MTTGADAVVRDAAGERLGAIEDYVLERASGHVTYVALDISVIPGEPQLVLLPFASLALDGEHRTPRLSMDLAALRVLPSFDADAYRPKPAAEGSEAVRRAPSKVLASELLKRPVWAGQERFGRTRQLVIDAGQRALAFLLVTAEVAPKSDPLLVPWAAAGWHLGAEAKDDGLLLDRGPLELAHAPRLKGAMLDGLANEELVARVYRFYELELPAGS